MRALVPPRRAWGLMALVLAGDLLSFGVFAVLGLMSHQTAVTLQGILRNAVPLAVAWLIVGGVLGAFHPSAVSHPRVAWWRVVGPWLVAGLVGLWLRSEWLHRPLVVPVVVIFLGGNALLLMLWRVAVSLWLVRRPLATKET
ncbi:MAG: DUF3054 domain-containing protein [Dehalococcoidia bacterium]|nr:DUF3054 domain-containing protein [Dehalococcoidia bacterium]MDW8120398.1 DUF3054 domain-containing protein [Chloroflexota bacterium]